MKKIRTLLVEDDENLRRLLAIVFRGWGLEVLEFADASKLLCSHPVCPCDSKTACGDILVSDQMMPGITGLELLKRHSMKPCPLPSENRAIITAASNLREIRTDASHLGAQVFPKPFDLDVLKKWISECAARVSVERELLLPEDIRPGKA